jgi:hypothetical protein
MRRIAMRWIMLGFLGFAVNLKRMISEASLISTSPCILSGCSSSFWNCGSFIMSRPIFLAVLRSSSTSVSGAKARLNFTVVQSRLKLVMWVSWPNGTMLSWPFWWRSRIERTEKPSTVPLALLPSMYSPTRKESSARKKMPDTMSRTSAWLPNDTARPSTEKPAISGVVLTPSCESTSRLLRIRMATLAVTFMTGMTVRSRDAAAGASSSPSPWKPAAGSGLSAM